MIFHLKPSKKPTKRSDEELLELGKKLQAFYEMGYVNKKQTLAFSFLKGIATGLGTIVGGTIVLAALLWLLSSMHEVPFVGHLTDSIRQTIDQRDSRP